MDWSDGLTIIELQLGCESTEEVEDTRAIVAGGQDDCHVIGHRQPCGRPRRVHLRPGAAGIDADEHGRQHVPSTSDTHRTSRAGGVRAEPLLMVHEGPTVALDAYRHRQVARRLA